MCERFVKLNLDTDQALFLAKNYPNAFVLLSMIAMRARRINGYPDGLIIGDALIGSGDLEPGMSRQNFRTAINKLIELGHIKIVSNGKTFLEREKSTIKVTITGLLVSLVKSTIYDINPDDGNQRSNQRVTNDQPTGNHKQERIRKKKKEKEEEPQTPSSASPPVPSKLKFREFVELTQEQHDTLKAKHGQETLDLMLDRLDSFKGSSGKKYDSDFHTMKEGGWVITQVRKDMNAQKQSNEKPFKHNPGAQSNGVSQGSPAKFQAARVLRGTNSEGSVASGGDHE